MNVEEKLIELIRIDEFLMAILQAVESLDLHDSWVCAGLIRGKVWDSLNACRTPVADIDVIYFDSSDLTIETEKQLEHQLQNLLPGLPWSVKNQARMHEKNGLSPFRSSYDGVAHFPETPTAVAVKTEKNKLLVMAPYGLEDVFHQIVRPTPMYEAHKPLHIIYQKRMSEKQWNKTWPAITIKY